MEKNYDLENKPGREQLSSVVKDANFAKYRPVVDKLGEAIAEEFKERLGIESYDILCRGIDWKRGECLYKDGFDSGFDVYVTRNNLWVALGQTRVIEGGFRLRSGEGKFHFIDFHEGDFSNDLGLIVANAGSVQISDVFSDRKCIYHNERIRYTDCHIDSHFDHGAMKSESWESIEALADGGLTDVVNQGFDRMVKEAKKKSAEQRELMA
jgi:hypothetical protein